MASLAALVLVAIVGVGSHGVVGFVAHPSAAAVLPVGPQEQKCGRGCSSGRSRGGSSPRAYLRMSAASLPEALIFDCDGVLADTERDGHRPAFNEAFRRKGIDCEWDVAMYGKLLETGGGKERMTAHWNEVGWPAGYEAAEAQQALVKELHLLKTELFNEAITAGKIPLRAGVLPLVDEAIVQQVPLAVCSTSNEKAVSNLVLTLMGKDRFDKFNIFAGDMVEKKKPNPDIYNLAASQMALKPDKVIVVEDSNIGLRAAKAAGMACIVTKSSYTQDEDFSSADRVVDELAKDEVTLQLLAELVQGAQA